MVAAISSAVLIASTFGLPSAPPAAAHPRSSTFAGPRGIAHHANGQAIRSAAAQAKAPKPLLYRTGFTSSEPMIGVTKKGVVYSDAFASNTRPGVVRSMDSGATWTDVT